MAREGPSAETGFDYPALVRGAFLGMVRSLLARVAQDGLPGDHHFFLTFATRHPGVSLSPRLLKQFPEEMTVVLQHQYWDLSANDTGFEVTLRFGGVPERLAVPWEALRAFVDPSASFGLRLAPEAPGDPATADPPAPAKTREAPAAASGPAAKVVDFGAYKRRDDEAG
jgi:hypothetical protein